MGIDQRRESLAKPSKHHELRFVMRPVTLVLAKKPAPGGDLIRVDLIRFPGSIPGAI